MLNRTSATNFRAAINTLKRPGTAGFQGRSPWLEFIKGLHAVLGKGSLLAYLISMSLRITEIHRVLKPTGSFYLHCDPTSSHYLKLVLDAVFCGQGGDFINEIAWCYDLGCRVSKCAYGRRHDVLFFYSKSNSYTFNWDKVLNEWSEEGAYSGRSGPVIPLDVGRDSVPMWAAIFVSP